MKIRRPIYLLALILMPCEVAPLLPGTRDFDKRPNISNRMVASFDANGLNMLDALLRLGRQERIPLGIEYLNPKDLNCPVTLHVRDERLGDIVRSILEKQVGYTWDVKGDVIHVKHAGMPSAGRNLLDHMLAEFSISGKTDLVTAATVMLPAQLRRGMTSAESPSGPTGIVGSILGGRYEDQVGPLKMRHVTVREVLDRLVSEGNKGAWVFLLPPSQMGKLPTKTPWYVLAYDDPRTDLQLFVARLLREHWEAQGTRK
jgi:hypothetical protein